MTPFRTFGRFRGAAFVMLMASVALGVACSSDHSDSHGPSSTYGDEDHPDNGQISLDETKLRGRIEDGTLSLDVPVTALTDSGATGDLTVRLLSVDGQTELGSTSFHYELGANEEGTFATSLVAPAFSGAQEELVDYVVRVEDGSGLRVTRSLMHVIPLYEVTVQGPSKVVQGRTASYRVKATDAVTRQPLENYEIELSLEQDGKVQKKAVTTGKTGDGVVHYEAPALGTVHVKAATHSDGTEATVEDDVPVEEAGQKLLLTTDKPIYQPGQVIHLRGLNLERGDNHPLASKKVTFEVDDGKGNKVFKKEKKTNSYGVASTDFRLGNIVNEGTYTVRFLAGDSKSEKTVDVSHYSLPKFDVAVKTEKPWYSPAQKVTGTIDAHYFFGKLVSGGDVLVEALSLDVGETLFQSVMGTLNSKGHYQFSLTLPSALAGLDINGGNAAVELRVTVTDTAGQKVVKTITLPVSATGATLALVPEATTLVPGVSNKLLFFATDPLGGPIADADVTITTPDDDTVLFQTDAYGQAEFAWTAPDQAASETFKAKLRQINGDSSSQSFDFSAQNGAEHVIVRTDKSVYAVGDDVKVDLIATNPDATVYVDWLNDGQAVDMRSLEADKGKATFTVSADTSLVGENRIEAYVVDDQGNLARTGRTVFVRGGSTLNVDVTGDKPLYAPGDAAQLTFTVTDENGDPAVAALGVQIVDQAVFSLVDAQPGLLRTYFELNDDFAQPSYEIQGPNADFSRLIFVDTNAKNPEDVKAAQKTSQGALAARGDHPLMGIDHGSYTQVLANAIQRLAPVYQQLGTALTSVGDSLVAKVMIELANEGCTPTTYTCGSSYFDQELTTRVTQRLALYDFWGAPFTINSLSIWSRMLVLKSSGPDEVLGNADDTLITVNLTGLEDELARSGGGDAGIDLHQGPNFVEGDGTAAGGGASGGPVLEAGGGASSSDSDGPRVRREFPETLYVNPSVITDENGKATIDLSMADSITEWRISTLANSASGKLGGGEGGVTVFQDFFVDIDFPANLTRGDEVTFPIAVYNYLDTPQTVDLSLEAGTWYTPLGATTTQVTLDPGDVVGVSFPVRVEEVGLQTLTVKAVGTDKSDAVARTVHVIPDGKAFPLALSGSLGTGSKTESVDFPAEAVPGSGELYLDVYPAFLSQVVSGMDSMLQVPDGCFEQTTSTAWPNVLVTEYMNDTKQITPEIQIKAESLMSAGYQRLLTFEHQGGGFSWFGEQDPAPYLSVTAFGLMEFSDMARVQTVDDAMIDRTKNWLVGQQEADGSWPGDQSEFFTFQTSTLRNTAFVVWALASAGYSGPATDNGLAYVKGQLGSDQDPYTLGIVANAFALAAPSDSVLDDIIAQLDDLKKTDGSKIYWDSGDTQTNFYGGGNDAAVSATALVAHALLSVGGHTSLIKGALDYITSSKDPSGNFGSTQATIWSLRALTLAARQGTDSAIGSVVVSVDDVAFKTVKLTSAQSDVMTRVDMSSLATTGAHDIKLNFTGSGEFSYNLVSSHNLPWDLVPAESAGPLSIDIGYDKSSLFVNDSVGVTVSVTNNTAAPQNMVLVTLGIAPGFEVETSDFDDDLAAGTLSKFEVTGRQLILYLTELPADATLTYEYRMRATMPVTAVDGGGEVHLYYEPEKRAAKPAQELKVAAN